MLDKNGVWQLSPAWIKEQAKQMVEKFPNGLPEVKGVVFRSGTVKVKK